MNPLSIVVFGITSNLAQIKLIPALFDLDRKGLISKHTKIYGITRQEMSAESKRRYFESILLKSGSSNSSYSQDYFERFYKKIRIVQGDATEPKLYTQLQNKLKRKTSQDIIYYFATHPSLYQIILQNLEAHKLNKSKLGNTKLVIEKPIGIDLQSARSLNRLLNKHFTEDQIFRVDHYLGKEIVQNILMFRFSNLIFEPLMRGDMLDHIQITVTEDIGIQGRSYYDQVGALKDVGQNHILKILAFITMNAPTNFSGKAIARERVAVLKQLDVKRTKIIFGQYQSYRNDPAVQKNSTTDTFFALKTYLKHPKFANIPIYIRAGKKLKAKVTTASLVFKVSPSRLLKDLSLGDTPNVITYRLQPHEEVEVSMLAKKPSHEIALEHVSMRYQYRMETPDFLSPYEHILYDVLRTNQTFFNHQHEIEAQWAFIDPLAQQCKKPIIYTDNSWGPSEANQLIEADGRKWIEAKY